MDVKYGKEEEGEEGEKEEVLRKRQMLRVRRRWKSVSSAGEKGRTRVVLFARVVRCHSLHDQTDTNTHTYTRTYTESGR